MTRVVSENVRDLTRLGELIVNWIAELERLDNLYRRGGLSQSEYSQAKSRLLNEDPSFVAGADHEFLTGDRESSGAAGNSRAFVILWIVMSVLIAFYGVRYFGPMARYAVVMAVFGLFVMVFQGKARAAFDP